MEKEGPNICRRLRDATKEVHDSSDKLVNLKLGVAMSDPKVWYHGLLVFSKIFFKLESCLDQCPSLGELDLGGLRRTKAFEQDLDFYFGSEWRTKPNNEAVQKYVDHLNGLAQDEPLMLIAYFYHLCKWEAIIQITKLFSPVESLHCVENRGIHSVVISDIYSHAYLAIISWKQRFY